MLLNNYDQIVPDHSTLTVFRERLQQNGKLAVFEALLAEIVQTAVESGIRLGSIQMNTTIDQGPFPGMFGKMGDT
jgi:hypothetical protein